MADQSYGLRFDIYERVHLSEEVIGIQELVELELLPRIQVVPGDEYASLRGHLHVSGLYRGDGGTQELTHLIPVEITVPLSRVNRLEDITVEIENFDVDVLSPHSLNITGVLSLRGIETIAYVPGTGEWSDEEYSVSHETQREEQEEGLEALVDQEDRLDVREEASAPSAVQFDPPSSEPIWSLPELVQQNDSSPPSKERETALESAPASSLSPLWADKESFADTGSKVDTDEEPRTLSQEQQPVKTELQEASNLWHTGQPAQEQIVLDEGDRVYTAEEYLENVQELEAAEPVIEPHVEDRPEMKIALGSKKLTDQASVDHVPLSTLLQSGRPPKEPEVLETSVQDTQELLTEDKEDVRWKSLFISGVQEQTPFRQVKLVIVQREETIDVIADRYQINPRELLLYNRLSEQSLEEGQVLYIP
ncbi:LysM peptidoglycan-binding domain-containing protein [Paenibacillus sp. YPG26]|uniref:LysM peptidoglycan-binding domain-containing protein n=1 Tax=Paenibacillus sp. YPG26 TaxID=2878915 RepID=UPI00203D5056|nr:LysM peptidoglycan-binding domain-containing protein [Paenibacillus sp. YPG26]USB34245.1 LysM peptidoglycan-binding domain-containing protein [Paenibacillus sp. YPG26]